jgi:hypothetical protein
MQRQTVMKALLVLSVIAVGEAGHVLLDALGADLAHHVFHIAFPLVAFTLFAVFVARDVRAHGWPRFSWQLRGHPRSG